MSARRIAIAVSGCLSVLLASMSMGIAPASAKTADDPCYFIVRIPDGSTSATLGPKVKQRIHDCAEVMQDGYVRAAIRLGKQPTSVERAWQAAIIAEFVRNDCAVVSDVATDGCEIFAEKWPYGYAGKLAKPGTVIVFGFEPL